MNKHKSQLFKWIAAGVILLAVLGWSVFNTLNATAPVQAPSTSKVRQGDLILTVEGSGTLEMKNLQMGFETAGVVDWIQASGSQVKAGDVIGVLESTQANLNQIEASLSMASLTSPAEVARMNLERMLEEDERDLALVLYQTTTDGPDIGYYADQVSITEAAYWDAVAAVTRARKVSPNLKVAVDKTLAAWEAALEDLEWAMHYSPNQTDVLITSAMLAQTESALQDIDIATAIMQGTFDPDGTSQSTELTEAWYELETASLLLEQTQITAPFDGILSGIKVNSGENVEAYQPILTLLDSEKTLVNFALEEADLRELNLGDPINVTLSAFPATTLKGEVTAIGSKVQPNGTVFIEGVVALPEGITIFSGMTVDVIVETRRSENTLILNSSAVFQEIDGTSYVWKVDALGNQEKVIVQPGISDLTNVEILNGLKAGDLVSLSQPEN
ncbi:MAG TPA: efflux RND transporter periplasmic adaptor subunit [Anaerolineales bacterium]|nr:efflux RND transporter periplasmic adaptor subunit [Anaerolineales bacterium]